MTRVTVVMPAHDEENVIGTALRGILDAPEIELEVIVVANGCTDRTGERARDAGERVRVIEIAEASKIAALNAGSRDVESYPVVYVDADVTVSGRDLVALAQGLVDSGAQVAAPKMRVRTSSSWWVRQYYRVWALTGYRSEGHIGSGVYMLTRSGRGRFGDFPAVIADDLFVQRLFAPSERYTPDDLFFAVDAPRSLGALVRRNTRIAAGNQQLAQVYPDLAPTGAGVGARTLVRRVWRRPGLWVGFIVYASVYLTTHRRAAALLAQQRDIAWNRDTTTRERIS
jgi:glycosyltransferase involved in cell wall biosynthesis